VTVPNLTPWRRSIVGDLTNALPKLNPKTSVPTLPTTSIPQDTSTAEQAVVNALAGTESVGVAYPPPTRNVMPVQETSPVRRRTPS
jgi:phospholipase C